MKEREIKDRDIFLEVSMEILTMSFWKTDASELPGCDWIFQTLWVFKLHSGTEIHKIIQILMGSWGTFKNRLC